MAWIALGLGSNVGDRLGALARACEALNKRFEGFRASSVYKSPPMYVLDQPAFLNMAAVAQTGDGPHAVLQTIKSIEREMGRAVRERNGPREIDIDLLAYGRLTLRSVGVGLSPLQVPHPRIAERRFVLEPLAELDPELWIPGVGNVAKLLGSAEIQAQTVVRFSDAPFPIHRFDA